MIEFLSRYSVFSLTRLSRVVSQLVPAFEPCDCATRSVPRQRQISAFDPCCWHASNSFSPGTCELVPARVSGGWNLNRLIASHLRPDRHPMMLRGSASTSSARLVNSILRGRKRSGPLQFRQHRTIGLCPRRVAHCSGVAQGGSSGRLVLAHAAAETQP